MRKVPGPTPEADRLTTSRLWTPEKTSENVIEINRGARDTAPAPPVLDPREPMKAARALVDETFSANGEQCIHHHRGGFYQWNGACYRPGGDRGNLRAVGDRGREISRQVRIKKAADRVVDLSPIIAEIRASGATSLGRIAKALNERGIRTPRGAEWQPVQVKRVLERVAA